MNGLRKRLFRQKLNGKIIKNYLTCDLNSRMIDEIYKVKGEMETQDLVDLDRIEEKMIDMYEKLLCNTMDLTDRLLEDETK